MWTVRIHPLVFEEDFPRIDRAAQQRILKAIHKKLSLAPLEYGKLLSGPLKNYWRLRVDDYRVIYRVERETVEVFVIKAGVRRDERVYRELSLRIARL